MKKELQSTKDVVLSIRPEYACKIMTGDKTVELRRRFTSGVAKGSHAYIYSTAPTKALLGYAVVESVEKLKIRQLWSTFGQAACITKYEFDRYLADLAMAYAIVLRHPQTFATPVSMRNLKDHYGLRPPQSFLFAPDALRGLAK